MHVLFSKILYSKGGQINGNGKRLFFNLGGKHMQHIDDVSQNCTLETI